MPGFQSCVLQLNKACAAHDAQAIRVSSLGRRLGLLTQWHAQIQLSKISFWHKTIDQDSQSSDGLRVCPDPVFSHPYTAGVLATEDRKWWCQDIKGTAKTYAGLSRLGAFSERLTGISRSLLFAFLPKGNWREQSQGENNKFTLSSSKVSEEMVQLVKYLPWKY